MEAAFAFVQRHIEESMEVKRRMAADSTIQQAILDAATLVAQAFQGGHKVLLFGNGGSAAEAQHIASAFVRANMPALALSTDTSVLTAIGNDWAFDRVFAHQVAALGEPGDVVIAISTSGQSPNVLAGAQAARAKGMAVVALTCAGPNKLASRSDIVIAVPAEGLADHRVQEAHTMIGHILFEALEAGYVNAPL